MATPVSNSAPLPSIDSGNGTLNDEFINGLVQGGAWQFGGGPRVLTYSFNINYDFDFFGNLIPGPGGSWTTSLADAVNRALTEWSNVANISFSNIVSGGYFFDSQADLAFTLTGDELQFGGAIALGVLPDTAVGDVFREGAASDGLVYAKPEGDVFLDNAHQAFLQLHAGGYGYEVILHEVGHALGLKHPEDDGANGRPTFAQLGISSFDSARWTLMSNTPGSQPSLGAGYAASPMPLDILAIQQIYGANLAHRVGDDVYFLEPNYGNAQITSVKTIWDAGGIDVIDASGFYLPNSPNAVTIDLRPGIGYAGNQNGLSGLLAIAYGVTIEKAIGTQSADTIIGNQANNTLEGGAGLDTLEGGTGDDLYVLQYDYLDHVIENPDDGIDAIDLYAQMFVFALDQHFSLPENVEALSIVHTDQFSAVNVALRVTGNSGDNVITGDFAANRLLGMAGNDDLRGAAGNDWLDGGEGADIMRGGIGDDEMLVDHAADIVIESHGEGWDSVTSFVNYSLTDNVEHLRLVGAASNGTGNVLANVLLGNAQSNVLDGGPGADTLGGAGGNDVYYLDHASDIVVENPLAFHKVSTSSDEGRSGGAGGRLSTDGRYVVFESSSVLESGASQSITNIYLKDTITGITSLVSGVNPDWSGSVNSVGNVSDDGRYVVFDSILNTNVPDDTNLSRDVFLRDINTGVISRVSTDSAGGQLSTGGYGGQLSRGGDYVAFSSSATGLAAGDLNGVTDVFVKNLQNSALTLVSTASDGTVGDGDSQLISFSPNGRYVMFRSYATNLVANDTNNVSDIYVKDLWTGLTLLATASANGAASNSDGVQSWLYFSGAVSDNGLVIFFSDATNLVNGDTNDLFDVFVKNIHSGAISILSEQTLAGIHGRLAISADGRYVTTSSGSVIDLHNGQSASLLETDDGRSLLSDGLSTFVSYAADLSADGRFVLVTSNAPNIDGSHSASPNTYLANNPLFDPGGADEVRTSVTHTLERFVENLILTGFGDTAGVGNSLNNVLTGNVGGNLLDGIGGADILYGLGGNDTLVGGTGDDYAVAGSGNDVVLGGDGADALFGDDGLDLLNGDSGNDALIGGLGADTLNGGPGMDTAIGEEGNDVINGEAGADLLYGYADHDQLSGGLGEDFLSGGQGNDTLNGGDGDDALHGEDGDDLLIGESGNDVLVGQGGHDTLEGGSGHDTTIGDTGNDVIAGGEGNDQLFGYAGLDTLNGGNGDDFLAGGDENDQLDGDAGGDVLDGEGGDDLLDGGEEGDNLNGNLGDDTINGGAGADGLLGWDGADVLNGGNGNDYMYGDRPDGTGSRGNDRFVFQDGTGNDSVLDFQGGAGVGDVIDLTGMGFASFTAVQSASSNVNGGVYINLDAGNPAGIAGDALFIASFTVAQMAANDFLLA